MNRNARISSILFVALAAFPGCSSKPSVNQPKKAELQTIRGKAQVLIESGGANDAALNAGSPSSVYIWEGTHRYRLFFKTPVEVNHGNEYIVEGIYAQKVIDEIGDPDQGKNGYPLRDSCSRAVTMAWSGLAFDTIDAQAEVLRSRVKRYPARPVFLVTRISEAPATSQGSADRAAPKADENAREITVPADKQKTFLIAGSAVQPAPLWEPAGGTVSCKVTIGTDGTISELETGAQLCESVDWSKFKYQPAVQRGHPVKVDTEIEVRFEPRK